MPARSAIPQPPALEDIAARTLTGDVRDFLLGHVRHMPKVWPQMNEREQQTFIDATERQAEQLVRKAVNLVGAQGFESFEISVGDFSKKGNRLEAKLTAPYSRETLGDLAEAGEAGPIVLSLVSMQEFRGERAAAKAMADQPDLMDQGREEVIETGDAETAGDNEAARLQAEALDGDAAVDEEPGPEAIQNGEMLEAGIKTLDTGTDAGGGESASAPGEDVIEAGTPKKRGRRSAEERVAASIAATSQEPPPKRTRTPKAETVA